MRLWNGWGDDSVTVTLPQNAIEMIEKYVGSGEPVKSATLDTVVASVPKSRMPKHPLITTDNEIRMRHSHGQSVKDWVALRFARFNKFTDGVASPSTEEEIHELVSFALKKGVILIPSGGRTSVVGHLTPPDSRKPVLTLSLEKMSGLKHLDLKSHLASFYPGTRGVDIESSLNLSGLTLGHYPQSYEYSTVGGWVVTRSYGQLSRGYGGIDQLFAGGRLVGGSGILELPPYPGSAAGPDIRQLVLGSEGRMGVLSEVLVRVKQRSEKEYFHGVIFPDWDHAMEAVRQLGQSSIPFCMLRLSNPEETRVSLALSGEGGIKDWLDKYLGFRGISNNGCILLLGYSGLSSIVRKAKREALSLCRRQKGIHLFTPPGNSWLKNRFRMPYLKNTLWDMGYVVDSLETAVSWGNVTAAMLDIEESLRNALLDRNEKSMVISHLSHVYSTGSSIYTTFLFRLASDPEETLDRWLALKAAASKAIQRHGGTISHQHGVGLDHAEYLEEEKGEIGISMLKDIYKHSDPKGLFNPGKLVR